MGRRGDREGEQMGEGVYFYFLLRTRNAVFFIFIKEGGNEGHRQQS